jgi:transcriptional regulator of aroF, aroG, tyrA and aromatic amino acid transport
MVAEPQITRNDVVSDLPPDTILFGKSKVMQEVKCRLERICKSTVPVLLQGEVGAGKEIFSCFIQQRSPGTTGPYARLNCAGLPPKLRIADPFATLIDRVERSDAQHAGNDGLLNVTLFFDQIDELLPLHQGQLGTRWHNGKNEREQKTT